MTRNIILRPQCKSLSLDEALALCDHALAEGADEIRFTGPEPTRHPYLRQVVEHLVAKGVRVLVHTTGGSRPRHYRRLADAGVTQFVVSPEDYQTTMRVGSASLGDRAFHNLIAIAEMGKLTVSE